ncbi:MAG: glycerol-3-phosphate dehydrogenase, partial [Clostridia bacterium]|nr:glycerol-3-phosphate dehydrogenase [Clostridia bacterium]
GYVALKGSLMTRGAREVARLIKAMGGNELSAYGLAHLGDYEATLFSEFSHNRKYGEMLVQDAKFDKLAEGVPTAAAMKALGEKYGVDLPITNAVYEICYQESSMPYRVRCERMLAKMFERETKSEFYS